MDSHNVPSTTCALKVNIKCCTMCQENATKKLKKMDGVESVSYDEEKAILRVSGNDSIDPTLLIKKFDQWGKKAELYSFQSGNVKWSTTSSSKKKIQDGELVDDDDDSSDSDNDRRLDAPNKHKDKNISWKRPSLRKNTPPPTTIEESPVNKQSAKKGKWFISRLFGKKEKEVRKMGNSAAATTSWHFPRTAAVPGYRPPGPYAGPYGSMNPYPPMIFPGPIRPPPPYSGGYGAMLPLPYGSMLPPLPYSHGYGTMLPPRNAMMHYTDYRDNFYNYP